MFSRHFILDEQSMSIIEQLGEHMPGGFLIYKADESEEILYANKAVLEIFGCETLEEFREHTGYSFRGMVHPLDYEEISAAILSQSRESESDLDHVEYRIIRKDGTIRWVDDYGHYVESDVYHGLYYVFLSDITDRHEQDESARALHSAVIAALARVYDSVWIINDLNTQEFELFRVAEGTVHLLPEIEAKEIRKFSDAFRFYSTMIAEEDRERFLEAVKPENIDRNTQNKQLYSILFRRIFNDAVRYYRVEFVDLDLRENERKIVVGFKNVDDEVRGEQRIRHTLDLRSAVIEALTQVYDSVWLISDIRTQAFELFRIDDEMAHLLPAEEAVKITKFSDAFAFYSGLVLEEDRQKFLSAVTKESIVRNTEDRKIYSVPFRRVFSSGIRYYRLEFAKLDLENGERGIVAGFKDVDEEVRKEQQIQRSLSLRSAVIEALTQVYDSVWLINDLENQRFELFRIDETLSHLLPASEAVKITRFSDAFAFYSNLVLKEDQEKFLEAVTKENIVKNTEDRRIYSVPFRRVFKDGVRYYRLEFAKLILDSGETNIVAGFKDVDDEVRKEQTIQSSLNLRAAVIEALTKVYDSVWLINDVENQRFELYRIDETLSHLLPASEAVKITRYSDAFTFYSKLVLEEDRPAFLAAVTPENILKNVEGRLIYSVPFRRMFKDGVRYYRLEFAKLDLGNGERGIVAGFKDVDEEVRKEQQIQQALREAIDTANASSKAKSDFLSSMSHDIRTPMNGIIGMTSIAAKNLDDRERVADCLRKIQESSGHLLSLINEVLDMNKIESGKVELVEEEFNLAELIDAMLAMTRPQMQAHGHSFRVNTLNVEHEQLIGDSRRIQQIFVNIMSNAIKYTPDGGKISLSVRENPTRTQDFGHFEFIFEDNGYGMTQEFLNHLFEPFARANDKQTAGIQGTGLGMAITRNLVRMMGGDITVKSVYGQGSKFTVSLYLKLQNRQPINYDNFINLRILVADDDPVCCESTCEMLNDMGMTSEWVLSGHAAVDRVRTRIEQGRGFFAVFVDWKLPDLGGVETVRQIRTLVGEEVPIIIFSAYDWTEIEQEARDAGATSFVSKPLFRTKLASLFDALVNHSPQEDDLEAPLRDLEAMHLDGRRILLAEDQEMNAEIAMDFMEMAGLEVDWAKDGEQAVELLKNSPDGYYAMFFTDIQMPVMNGYEAAQVIRAMDRPYARNIPIVAMTANAFNDDIIRAKQAGMNEHIAKPIDVEALARVLSLYIK